MTARHDANQPSRRGSGPVGNGKTAKARRDATASPPTQAGPNGGRLLDAEKAIDELRSKPMAQIEHETAITWGGRAAASFRLCVEADGEAARFRHFYEGENYRQEALEHASMAADWQSLIGAIHAEIEEARGEAFKALDLHKQRGRLGRPGVARAAKAANAPRPRTARHR